MNDRLPRPTDAPPPMESDDGMREFLMVLRRSLLIIVCYIEKRYQLTDKRARVDGN